MTLLFINHTFLPKNVGGAELHTFWMAREMAARGHSVEVWCGEESSNVRALVEEREIYQGVNVTRLKFPVKFGTTVWCIRSDVREWALSKLARNRVEVAHIGLFWNLSALAHALHESSIPFVLDAHLYSLFCARHFLLRSDGTVCDGKAEAIKCRKCMTEGWSFGQRLQGTLLEKLPREWRDSLRRRLGGEQDGVPILRAWDAVRAAREEGKWLMRHANALLATTEFVARAHRINGAPPERILVSPHGIPATRRSSQKPLPRADGTIRFGVISRLTPEKGIDTLIEAVLQIPREIRLEVRIFGDLQGPGVGDFGSHLRSMASGEPRIRFEGPIRNEELDRAYAEIDLLVVPSRWHEVQGLTALEALARGTPVVVSDLGGLPEAVRSGENGFVFKGGDAADLSRIMTRVVREPALVEHWRGKIRPVISISEAAQRLEAIFLKIREEGVRRDDL